MVSVLSSLASLLCYTTIINLQSEKIVVNNVAKGNCVLCCPIDENNDIRYILYTRDLGQDGVVLPQDEPGPVALANSARNDTKTIVYVHGFSEMAPGTSGNAIRDAYLNTSDVNVILVDWRKLSAMPWYSEAVSNTKLVGRNLGKFLLNLDKGGIPLKTTHLIGFSLGAAIVGIAGKSMPWSKTIPRITGLDPALPLYALAGKDNHLAAGDADYVDVIHTDAGVFGHPKAMGDADFYPNGGLPLQPGCRADQLVKIEGYMAVKYVSCSHQRAWRYYVESVKNPRGFPATRCNTWTSSRSLFNFTVDNFMGARAKIGKTGVYCLETNKEPPFGKRSKKV